MKLVAILLIYWGCVFSETRGEWMEYLKNTIDEIINIFHEGGVQISRRVTDSVQRGLINQWVTPRNLTYDYVRSNIDFYVYTRQNWLYGQRIWPESPQSIKKSLYNPWKKTAVLIHGFGVDSSADSIQLIKESKIIEY